MPDWEAILHETGDPGHPQIVMDTDFVLRAGNPTALNLLGWTYDDSYGVVASDRIHPDDLERAMESYGQASIHPGHRPPAEFRLQHADGTYIPFDVSARSLPSRDAVLLTLQPIDARGGVEDLALENVAVLETLTDGSDPTVPVELVVQLSERHVPDTVWCAFATDPGDPTSPITAGTSTVPLHVVRRVAAATVACDDVLGEALRREVSFTGTSNGLLTADAPADAVTLLTEYPTVTATPATDQGGQVVGMVVAFRRGKDVPSYSEYSIHTLAARLIGLIVDWTRQRHELVLAANQDALTDLDNRRSLLLEIDAASDTATRRSVGVLDLDTFSEINNTLGHDAGDRILQEVAGRIPGAVPRGTRIFRTGGDEFTFVFPDHLSADALRTAGDDILGAIRLPVDVRGDALAISGSLGIVVATTDGLESAITLADHAMYVSKRAGGDRLTLETEPASLGDQLQNG